MKTMTISVTKVFFELIERISRKTGLKKSTIIKIAVEEWVNKNEM